MESNDPKWLAWGKRLQAIAQTGLTYAHDPYDVERYKMIREIAAEITASGFDVPPEAMLDLFSKENGYATPKVDVRGVVFRGEAMLLVRERSDGLWSLPGGWADVGDTPAEGAVREIREEAGLITRAVKLMAVYDRSRHRHRPLSPVHLYKLFFLCEELGGELTPSEETSDAAFFRRTELPEISLGRVTVAQIERLFELGGNAASPTDFD